MANDLRRPGPALRMWLAARHRKLQWRCRRRLFAANRARHCLDSPPHRRYGPARHPLPLSRRPDLTMDSIPPHMRPERSFQGFILALQRFWADQGCVILQPYDMEMGAGTFHPATTLRALGPKPWKAAYVQPSRRPKDGRYGENPNRLQHYYQFQVIIKPSPPD